MIDRIVVLFEPDLAECVRECECACRLIKAASEYIPKEVQDEVGSIELRNAEGALVTCYDGRSWVKKRSLGNCELSQTLFFVTFSTDSGKRATVIVDVLV